MKTIGLLGGMSWESSLEYYRSINRETARRLGGLHSASILMHSVDFDPLAAWMAEGLWDRVAQHLVEAARRLKRGGADFLVIATNTMHKVAPRVAEEADMPLLHIGDPVGRAAGDAGVRRVGLLGTRFTMEDAFLKDYLVQHFGLEVVTPDQAGRDHIHRIIFEELCLGRVTDEGRAAMRRLMDGLQADGAQAVILGCTELPMLVDESAAGLTVLDTTRLHAHAAVDRALADEPGP